MPIDEHIAIVDSGKELQQKLLSAIQKHLDAPDPRIRSLVRIEVPIFSIDPLVWLGMQSDSERMYWRGRHADDRVAMFGVAKVMSGDSRPEYPDLAREVDDFLERPGADLRLYGGMRFDLDRNADHDWYGFPAWRFVLPRFEMHQRGKHTLLCCNLVLPEDYAVRDALIQQVQELCFPDSGQEKVQQQEKKSPQVPKPVSRVDNPGFEGWKAQVNWSLDAFHRDLVDKVVLARRVDFSFQQAPDPVSLLRILEDATPNCFHFLFTSQEGVFLGATPERLFFRRGREVTSEAVAGTRPRGETSDDDQAYMASLLDSEKDQREHAFVRERIRDVLGGLCDSVSVDENATEMRLAQGRHLVSRVSGRLREGVTDFHLLEQLPPTPAVGGVPTEIALEAIHSLEDFDRGWYAGPVGWIGRDSAEFAVALRCGVVRGSQLSLFSGAGLVQGSDPGSEWIEIEQKITDFTKIIGLEIRTAD